MQATMATPSTPTVPIPIATDPKARKFVEMWRENPNIDKKVAAAALGVSRQTVYNWLAKLQSGKRLGTRGKHRKYGYQRSVPRAMRIPEVVDARMCGVHGEDMVTRFLEQMVPVWWMQWEQKVFPVNIPDLQKKLREQFGDDANKFIEQTVLELARLGAKLRKSKGGSAEAEKAQQRVNALIIALGECLEEAEA